MCCPCSVSPKSSALVDRSIWEGGRSSHHHRTARASACLESMEKERGVGSVVDGDGTDQWIRGLVLHFDLWVDLKSAPGGGSIISERECVRAFHFTPRSGFCHFRRWRGGMDVDIDRNLIKSMLTSSSRTQGGHAKQPAGGSGASRSNGQRPSLTLQSKQPNQPFRTRTRPRDGGGGGDRQPIQSTTQTGEGKMAIAVVDELQVNVYMWLARIDRPLRQSPDLAMPTPTPTPTHPHAHTQKKN